MVPAAELHLARHAETAWSAVVRPWLEAGRGRLERAFVIVATRGQAQGLKQRCLVEGVPLLGVEFLTPGLARKKWHALRPAPKPAMGRELLLLGLRWLIARRLAGLASADAAWGFWQSLQSDPERALDDFDELLKGGFRAADFPLAPLREIFGELTRWVEARGYTLAPLEAEQAAAEPLATDAPAIGGRVLVCGLGAEMWGEFHNVAAFVRRCAHVTVVLPEPEFRGHADHDERWVEWWGATLGVEALPLDAEPPAATCEAVGALWLREAGAADRARVLIGRTRGDEMRLVAAEIETRLGAGAENIAVVFPRADAAHLQLARVLDERGIAFTDLLETAGPPPVDTQAQRALLAFHERGGRVDELLALWPLLRAVGAATLSVAEARRACERSFDTRQTHVAAAHVALWEKAAPELARIARLLLPAWPAELTLTEALQRFRATCEALELEAPERWGALDALAAQESAPVPLGVLVPALASFLSETHPGPASGHNGFARVTLTTRRRGEALAWSHAILVESNAGVWPSRREPSCWLTDEQRAALNARRRFPLGLFTADDRAVLERNGWAAFARDTQAEVIFSAALHAEENPEVKLAPNAWVERVLWTKDHAATLDLEAAFERGATAWPAERNVDAVALDAWQAVWLGRRDPTRAFDEFFFAGDPARIAPERLPARLIERGVQDPAELWFEAVLGVRRVEWFPLTRARRKALGLRAHELLALALRPAGGTTRGFGEMPAHDEARVRLGQALVEQREQWPADRYWDSFHAELAHVCRALLDNVYALPPQKFVATEVWLPEKARLPLGARALPIAGRMDLVLLDRPEWSGARIDIVDFKTGGDADLSAERMARSGASLQLGVYLAAAASLGVASGAVWMLKPEAGAHTQLTFDDMKVALAKLQWLEAALTRGIFGALTRDRSEYAPEGCAWPLASTPVPQAVLARKFALTFGAAAEEAVHE